MQIDDRGSFSKNQMQTWRLVRNICPDGCAKWFQPIMASQYENFQTKGAVMRKHLTPDKISQSHANKSCCPERQNLSNDEGDEEVVTENDYVKSQLYSILK